MVHFSLEPDSEMDPDRDLYCKKYQDPDRDPHKMNADLKHWYSEIFFLCRYTLRIPGDKKKGTKPQDIVWSTKPPSTSRLGPENIMTVEQRLSDEAKAAQTPGDMWSLFFTKQAAVVKNEVPNNLAKFKYFQA